MSVTLPLHVRPENCPIPRGRPAAVTAARTAAPLAAGVPGH